MLLLPIKPVNARALCQYACALLGDQFTSDQAITLLAAIGYQETGFRARAQVGGPALGLFSMQENAVADLLAASSTGAHLAACADACVAPPTAAGIYAALREDDILAAQAARLLLWAEPSPLPDSADAGWAYYLRVWRPGKPRPAAWADSWIFANTVV